MAKQKGSYNKYFVEDDKCPITFKFITSLLQYYRFDKFKIFSKVFKAAHDQIMENEIIYTDYL